MNELKLASRYAKALFEYAEDEQALNDLSHDINIIMQSVKSIPEMLLDLNREDIVIERRIKLAQDLLKTMSLKKYEDIISFFRILMEKRRITLLPYIALLYRAQLDKINNVLRVGVTVADKSLVESTCKEVKMSIQEILNKEVECEAIVDESIIGGTIIKIGDLTYDESVIRRIDDVVDVFKQGA